jgi:Fe-S oxidoreductase
VGPLPDHERILERLDEVGHPQPENGRKGDWLREMGREAGTEGRETLLFVGDHYGLRPDARESLKKLVHLLEAAGMAFGALGDDEPSTARVALDIGDLERFDRHAETAARAVRDSGAATVVCVDPHDLNAFRAHIPKVADLDGIRFVHAVEFLDELASAGRLRPGKPIRKRVAYHDPCTLGRLSEPFRAWSGELVKVKGQLVIYDPPRPVNRGTGGCYEPPRRLLRTIPGLETVEFHRRREAAFCCGGGDAVEAGGYGELVARTAAHRMEEARAVGAELVATACPRCEANLGAAPGEHPIPIRNVIDLLAESLGV